MRNNRYEADEYELIETRGLMAGERPHAPVVDETNCDYEGDDFDGVPEGEGCFDWGLM